MISGKFFAYLLNSLKLSRFISLKINSDNVHRWCRIFCLLPASRLLRIASSTCCMISANFSHLKNLILCMSNHKGPNFSIEIRESLWLLKTLLIKVETHVVNFLCPNALFPTCFPTLSSTNGVSHHDLPLIRNKLLTLISSCSYGLETPSKSWWC